MCSQHCGPDGADPFREGGEWKGCQGTACCLYLLSSESLCKSLQENCSHTWSLRVSSEMPKQINVCDSDCACACSFMCLCEIIKCASKGQLQDNVPELACVHLCVHTCIICMALPVYTTVLAQGLARWHCARFKCVLISASFLLLRLMPVFCWSVYHALSPVT